tara:strand:+ start:10334 stop:11302 length:969 start_codon:yes stop_codon:yes gene_type:complete
MPVTIIFYGLTRSLKKTIKSLKKNIFKPLSDQNIPFQIYIHTYDLKELSNERSGENKVKLDHNSDLKLIQSVTKATKITIKVTRQEDFLNSIKIEDYISHGDPWGHTNENVKYKSLKNLLCQLNSLRIISEIAIKRQDDAYLFLRPDLLYVDKLDIEVIKTCEQFPIHNNIKKAGIVFTPPWAKNGGLNDRIACCSFESAKLYGLRFNNSQKYSQKKTLHSETYLDSTLYYVKRQRFFIRALRIRANGNISPDIPKFSNIEKQKDLERNINDLLTEIKLPEELILNICEYADFRCYLCKKKLFPWKMIGYSGIYLCNNECYA